MREGAIFFQGKKVFFRLYGEGKNKCFFYHGFPGSSIQASFVEPYLKELDLQICSFDRPGYGGSENNSKFEIRDSDRLIAEMADALQWKTFYHVAVSGGTPYALSAAREPRTKGSLVMGALGPLAEKDLFSLYPRKVRLLMKAALLLPSQFFIAPVLVWKAMITKGGEKAIRKAPFLSKSDVEALLKPKASKLIHRSALEAFIQGPRGPQQDVRRFQLPWKFEWKSVVGKVLLVHGLEDQMNLPFHSEHLARLLPNAELRMISGEGHYSLPIHESRRFMEELLKN